MTRRDLLRRFCNSTASFAMGSAVARLGMMNALAQSPTPNYRALVCVFLFGGNDGNNLIVPNGAATYPAYQRIRSNLALAQNTLLPVVAATGSVPYGFHQRFPEVHQLFIQRRAAVVANVGTLIRPTTRAQYRAGAAVPSNLYSHSDQQQEWQTSIPQGNGRTGWGGRLADLTAYLNQPSNFPTAVSVSGNSIFVNGTTAQPTTLAAGANSTLDGSNNSAESNARNLALEKIISLESGASLLAAAGVATAEGLRVAKILQSVLSGNSTIATPFPNTSLGQQLQQIARVIQARTALGMNRQIFFCSTGGYDTHTNQIADQDNLFLQLSQALGAFYNATVELQVSQQVTAFTESDFGRTFQPSSGGGTDHAWGSHHLVVGGAVRGGDVYGRFPTLALGGPDDAGDRGVWIPTTSVDQYGATLASWFGVPANALTVAFPNLVNFPAQTLGFMT